MVYSGNLPSHISPWVEGLRQLLRDRAAAPLAGIMQQDRLEKHSSKPLEINSGMLVETDILRGHGGVDKVRRDLIVGDIRPVLDMERGQNLPVLGEDLRGQFVVRVFQVLERRDVGEHPDKEYHNYKKQHRKRHNDPEPLGYFLSSRVGHNKDKFITKFGKLPCLWLTLQIEMANYL